ncbi:EAL domain-containing protein [Francisellaceae bacterium]|nr:EAL domain-containing protein [Francisellaceae bacterium]
MNLLLARSLQSNKDSVHLRVNEYGHIVEFQGNTLATLNCEQADVIDTHLSGYVVNSGLALVYGAFLKARFQQETTPFYFTHDASVGWEVSWHKEFGYLVYGIKLGFVPGVKSALLNMADSLPILVSYVCKDLRYRYNNLAYENFFNVPREKLLNKPVKDFIGSETFDRLLPIYKKVLAGNSYKTTQSITLANNQESHLVIEYRPSFSGKEVVGFYAIIQDVTEYRSSSKLLKTIYQAINDQFDHPNKIISQLLKMGREYLGLDIGIISSIVDDEYKVEYLSTDLDGIQENDTFNLDDTYCAITLSQDDVVASEYAGVDSKINEHPCYEAFKLECYIGIRLSVNNQIWGTLNYSSPIKRNSYFNDLEYELMRLLGKAVEKLISNRKTIRDLNQLGDLNQLLNEASEVAQIGFWEYDAITQEIYWSDGVYRIFDVQPGEIELTYDKFFTYVPDDDKEIVELAFKNSVLEKQDYFITHKIITANNRIKHVEERGKHTFNDDGELIKSVGSIYDITAQFNSEKKFKDLLENASDGIHILDLEGNVVECSASFAENLGYSYKEALKLNVSDWEATIPKEALPTAIADLIKTPKAFETKHRLKDGSILDVQVNAKGILIEGETYLYASQRDISELKRAEEKLSRMALFDEVTGIPNRANFLAEIPKAISRANREGKLFAIFFIDLDNFKLINDRYGHHSGDLLLKAVVDRLAYIFRKEDRLARIGGDEFAAIVENVDTIEEIRQIAQRCIDSASKAFDILGSIFNQYFSIGISLYPDSAENADKLLQCADTAMYRAKEKGKNSIAFYREELDQIMHRNSQIENALRQAIVKDELSLVYQPQYNESGSIFGVEALLRWHNDDIDNLYPDEFIPIAEKNRQIIEIGQWVLSKSIDDWNRLKRNKIDFSLQLSVNVSSVQLYSPGFINNLLHLMNHKQFNPKNLTLEITETHIIEDIKQASELLKLLNGHGIKIALDDFGTGHSSLHYLANLPLSYFKIDKEFVLNSGVNNNDVIMKSIMSLGVNLGIGCIAEGVKTIGQLNYLKQIGCKQYQGFYFSEPLSIEHIDDMLNN